MSRGLRLGLASVGLCGAACAVEERTGLATGELVGLHAPGSLLGASDPTDVPQKVGLGNRCLKRPDAGTEDPDGFELDAGTVAPQVGTPGELSLRYTTRSLMGRYAPRNCSAVWIESAGAYVATLELTAGLRRPGLLYFQERACPDQLGPDAMTSATRRDHMSPHMLTWKGVDALERPVPDGTYRLYVEVTESDKEPGVVQHFDFEKGPAALSVQVPVAFDGALVDLSLTWTPESDEE